MNRIEATVLGKQIKHPRDYSPDILVAVPRSLNREHYGIRNDALPFMGFDVWHAYELGFLTEKGLPVTGVLKMVYACDSEFLVESKSLKLYLNSFNMGRYGKDSREGISLVLSTIKEDLKALLKVSVALHFHSAYETESFDFSDYPLLEALPGAESLVFNSFKEKASLLDADEESGEKELKVGTNLLRSNCKITQQPDWGSAFIYLKSRHALSPLALLQYIVSIRDENHFHEEICEMLYKRLYDRFSPEILMVACLYTRRGGIDICPVRANRSEYLPQKIIEVEQLTRPAFRQ